MGYDGKARKLALSVSGKDAWATSRGITTKPMAVRCDTPSDYAEWTTWAGRAPDMVHGFLNAASWDASLLAARTWAATWATTKVTWAMPLASSTQNMAATYSGAYDVYINAIADVMLAHNPNGPIYVRLGWEAANPTPFPWSATSAVANARTDYISAFQWVANIFKKKSSRFKLIWCVANQNFASGVLMDPTDATVGFYPGDAYVDMIGIDAYLIGVDVSNGMTFDHLAGTTTTPLIAASDISYGLHYLADFARAHGKTMSIDEWGVGADRPDYIRDMATFIANPANKVEYHGYWNKNAGTITNGQYPFPCRLSDRSNSYPKSKAAFLWYFFGIGAPYLEQPETSAFIARTTQSITDARRAQLDTLYAALKAGGLLQYLDALVIGANSSSEVTQINFCGAGGYTTSVPRSTGRLAVTGSPAFVADRGWTGDGTTGSYLTLGANLTTALNLKFSQNDAHMGIFALTANSNSGAQTYEAGVNSSFIGCAGSGNQWIGRTNTASTVTLSNAGQGVGHIMWQRTGAAAWASYYNGVSSRSGTDASAAPTNDSLRMCGIPSNGGGVNQIAAMHIGKSLPIVAQFNGPNLLYTALYNYLHGIGAV